MTPVSLFQLGAYTLDWVQDFYNQCGIWWGAEPALTAWTTARISAIERFCGPGPKRILDLGAGTGSIAAGMADLGHTVIAVEFAPTRACYAHELARQPRSGVLTVLEADFYTVELAGPFDVVCHWGTFGLGSDADQRRLLKRMTDWLAAEGCVLMDVYSPTRPAREAGAEKRLAPLKGVPGSVEMIERCHFDPVQCRWIDEWQPTAEPDKALAQAIRCYSPADLCLLLEGTGLSLKQVEVNGQRVARAANGITVSEGWLSAWCYLAQLTPDDVQGETHDL